MMNIWTYIYKSLRHYRKQHLAVFAGTLLGTAVLTGALIVGDSVKLSLQQIVQLRLGKTQAVLNTGDRFVRAALADEIAEQHGLIASAIIMNQGMAINPENEQRLPNTQIFGVDADFWELGSAPALMPGPDEALVSRAVLDRLQIQIGASLLVRMSAKAVIPLNAPFVSHEAEMVSFRLKIVGVADDEQMGRFSLQSNQAQPLNVFVSRDFLAEKLQLTGKANLLLTTSPDTETLNELLNSNMQLDDYGLRLRPKDDPGVFEISSDRIFIDPALSARIAEMGRNEQGVLTYLVNTLKSDEGETPYSFVSGLSSGILKRNLEDGDMVVNQWLADDLHLKIGDSLSLSYYIIGRLRRLEEVQRSFVVKEVVAVESENLNRKLMPAFPGLADAGSCSDWEAGIPIDLSKIRDKDEQYWDSFRGTPKAYIRLEVGQDIWANPFGDYTALWLNDSAADAAQLSKELLQRLRPSDINFRFQPIRSRSMYAASHGVDFGELFLSLSFFVIAAAILLIILIQALNIETRGRETGILSGLGFSRKYLFRLRLLESLPGILTGGLVGALAGILYNQGLLYGLNSVWRDAVRTDQLQVFILGRTLVAGALSGIILSLATVYFVGRSKLKYSIQERMHRAKLHTHKHTRSKIMVRLMMIVGFLGSISMLMVSVFTQTDQNASLFLGASALFMLGCFSLIRILMNRMSHAKTSMNLSIIRLSFINLGRNPGRSLTVIILLALGTYTTIITGANRKTFFGSEQENKSGTGGFDFWVEWAIPCLFDLNTEDGKAQMGLDEDATTARPRFYQFHLLDGDDASCLNLNQVQQPKLLGINPNMMNERQSFTFTKLLDGIDRKSAWLALNRDYGPDIVPAFADQTVITWGLIKKIGDTLYYHNEAGETIKVLLVGGLDASIFQGHLLIADKQFSHHFPSVAGSRVMLVEGPEGSQEAVRKVLEDSFVDYGLDVQSTARRLAEFNSVTNTYLSVFMFLGGLGVILGTIGLGIVLHRNLLDRKSELALLQAIGFDRLSVFWLVFSENLALLVTGMVVGISAAIIGILPTLITPSFTLNNSSIMILVGLIFCSALVWIVVPLIPFLKQNLMDGLRSE